MRFYTTAKDFAKKYSKEIKATALLIPSVFLLNPGINPQKIRGKIREKSGDTIPIS